MSLPNLFIVGAPKCGTTSLFTWLSEHPQVCGSNPKEPSFFIDPETEICQPQFNFRDSPISDYEQVFAHSSSEHKILFEASPYYMYQNVAIEAIPHLASQPKLIFLLREPAKRLLSVFEFSKNNCAVFTKDISFAKFVDALLNQDQAVPVKLTDYCQVRDANLLQRELHQGEYIHYLLQWQNNCEPSRIKILLFEDLVKNPQVVLQELCDFLEIDGDFYKTYAFAKMNESYHIKNAQLQRLAIKLTRTLQQSPLKDWLRNLYFKFAVQRNTPRKRVDNSNLIIPAKSTAEELTLQRLRQYYASSNQRLADTFQLDMHHW
jgi:hypothetical protein